MKMEDHFKDTLNRAVANEPPVLDAWDRFEQRAVRGRRVRLFAAIAAAAAVAVASVIVVPRLGTGDGIGLLGPDKGSSSPTPISTVDPYENWATYRYDLYGFTVRHPKDWRVVVHEGNPELLAPGQIPTAAGEPTMAVTLSLLTDEYYLAKSGAGGRSAGRSGRPFVSTETEIPEGGRRVDYRFDWAYCQPHTPGPDGSVPLVCNAVERTLVVTIHAGTDALWDKYGAIAELIVVSVAYTPQSLPQ